MLLIASLVYHYKLIDYFTISSKSATNPRCFVNTKLVRIMVINLGMTYLLHLSRLIKISIFFVYLKVFVVNLFIAQLYLE